MTDDKLLANVMCALLSRGQRWSLTEREFPFDGGSTRGWTFEFDGALELDGQHARAIQRAAVDTDPKP